MRLHVLPVSNVWGLSATSLSLLLIGSYTPIRKHQLACDQDHMFGHGGSDRGGTQ